MKVYEKKRLEMPQWQLEMGDENFILPSKITV
jgi:hypothetical protein